MQAPTQFPAPTRRRRDEAGGALAVAVHVLLLVLVLGQIVYLSSRHRVRWDLTSDQLWSLTDSTRDIVGKLDKQLLVEAYFSPKEELPIAMRETRSAVDNFLDELVQLGRGRVLVQRFDPNSDKAIGDRCTRIGVKPEDVRGTSASSISVDRYWLGLRLVYGGSKQKVLTIDHKQIGAAPPLVEALITPAIKEVVTTEKRRFGYMEWMAGAPGPGEGGQKVGWNFLRTLDAIARRFEFQNYKNGDEALVPDDVDTLFLFRPEGLSDRMKYVIDQFVVRGGTLVVFADACDYMIGPQRVMNRIPFSIDTPDSDKHFVDQLAHYGIDWQPKVLADMAGQAHRPRNMGQPFEYFAATVNTNFGPRQQSVPYPYFFHALAGDWSEAADQFARNAEGEIDQDLATRYREQFQPGLPSDEFLFTAFKNPKVACGPGLYWPTLVCLLHNAGVDPDLPSCFTGEVLMWSSPATLLEDPPARLNPLGFGDPRAQTAEYQKFMQRLNERYAAEPRQQAPLMCEVSGRFTSFFTGDERPLRPSEKKEREAEAAAKAKEQPADGKSDEPVANETEVGPPAPAKDADADQPKAAPEAEMLAAGEKPGRIVMIGDSDFVRDDLVRGNYAQAGGPMSIRGPAFFNSLCEWIAQDRDLVALQSRVLSPRTLTLVEEPPPGTDPRDAERTLATKRTALRAVNVVLPCALLGAFGLLVFLLRRGQKRRFLQSVA
ncbi:MAG: GldG family protein [Planctomycetes bacterium]|nr:GldG family protein [Planctomycetota bacterium]